MLARNLAQQLGTGGVRVNAIAPSAIRNERLAQFLNQGELEKLALQFPIPRVGEPGDVAAAALFLCSNASSWITGITRRGRRKSNAVNPQFSRRITSILRCSGRPRSRAS